MWNIKQVTNNTNKKIHRYRQQKGGYQRGKWLQEDGVGEGSQIYKQKEIRF